jgi:hypothetical protein
MKVIEKHLDTRISCPFTGKVLWVREIDPRMYPHLIGGGYGWLFEEEEVVNKPIEIKKTTKK